MSKRQNAMVGTALLALVNTVVTVLGIAYGLWFGWSGLLW
jgi:hypothetical protein